MEDQKEKLINIDLDTIVPATSGVPASCLPEERPPPTKEELEKIENVNALMRGDFKSDQFLPERVVEAAALAAEKFSSTPKCAMAATMLMSAMIRYAGLRVTAEAKIKCAELQKEIDLIRASRAKACRSTKKKIIVSYKKLYSSPQPDVHEFRVNVNASPKDKK